MKVLCSSRSWESLRRVRRLHVHASQLSSTNNLGAISQNDLCATLFGFMGYALIRPNLFGIQCDSEEDLDGFIHFWAVIGHILGIEDQYNICLHPREVVTEICRIYLRLYFITILQLESPLFKKMLTAMMDGLRHFLPIFSYESTLFLTRRVAGIPGYQFDLDLSKEIRPKNYFSSDEISQIRGQFDFQDIKDFISDNELSIIEVKRRPSSNNRSLENDEENSNCLGIKNHPGLNHPTDLTIKKIDMRNISQYWNSSKFVDLSIKDKLLVRMNILFFKLLNYRCFRKTIEFVARIYAKRLFGRSKKLPGQNNL